MKRRDANSVAVIPDHLAWCIVGDQDSIRWIAQPLDLLQVLERVLLEQFRIATSDAPAPAPGEGEIDADRDDRPDDLPHEIVAGRRPARPAERRREGRQELGQVRRRR